MANDTDMTDVQESTGRYMTFFRQHFQSCRKSPKQHILECHCADFMKTWKFGLGLMKTCRFGLGLMKTWRFGLGLMKTWRFGLGLMKTWRFGLGLMKTWRFGLGLLGEHGGEETHAVINKLKCRAWGLRNETQKLQFIMKEHMALESPALQ